MADTYLNFYTKPLMTFSNDYPYRGYANTPIHYLVMNKNTLFMLLSISVIGKIPFYNSVGLFRIKLINMQKEMSGNNV